MRIGHRELAKDHPPYVIAEVGVNHDGSVERALELTDAAAGAGADAVKLQLFEADRLMSKAAKLAAYQRAAGETDPVEMLRRLELSIDDMARVVERAHARRIHAIVSVFSVELVAVANRLPWDAYKTASPDIVNRPLLEELAATGKPLIVSTGASTLQEVARCLKWLHPYRERLMLMQCVSSYPTPPKNRELGGILAIADIFPGPVGYSDHTADAFTAVLATALGAQSLEKHLTYDKGAPGPDHAASLTPKEFAEYVAYARKGQSAREHMAREHTPAEMLRFIAGAEKLSTGGAEFERVKRVLPIEVDVRTVSRQSLTTTRALAAGDVLTRGDLTIKRPGTGIPPYEMESVVGRSVVRALETDAPVTPADLA